MDQKGFTLIEVLLSVVILSIVLTVFMSFFSQSSLFIRKNEEKLGTSNTAQMVLTLIQENTAEEILASEGIINELFVVNGDPSGGLSVTDNEKIKRIINRDLNSKYSIKLLFKNVYDDSNNRNENLILVKVIVADPENNEASETFTYIRR